MHIRFCFLSATLAAGFGLLAFPSAAPAQNPGSELIAAMELPEAPRAQQTPAGGQINQQEQPRTPQVLLAFDASSRGEAIPLLEKKLGDNLGTRYSPDHRDLLVTGCRDRDRLDRMPVPDFMSLLAQG